MSIWYDEGKEGKTWLWIELTDRISIFRDNGIYGFVEFIFN